MLSSRLLARSRPQKALDFPRLQRPQSSSSSSALKSSLRLPQLAFLVAGGTIGWFGADAIRKTKAARIGNNVDGPPALSVDAGYPFKYLSPLSPAQATELLNKGSYFISFNDSDESGVTRYYGSQVASNEPCEDVHIHGKFPSPSPGGRDWLAWGIFDGHLGSQTSQALAQTLVPYAHHSLAKLKDSSNDDAAVHQALKAAFLELDDDFVKHAEEIANSDEPFSVKVARLSTGSNGSCALLSLWDPSVRKLHIALTGDSRAVLGRRSEDGTGWEAVPLSVDQSGRNEAEIARIRAEHPGEEDIVKNGRVIGLATARAFGDGHWKWPAALQVDMKRRYFTDTLRANQPEIYKTPPYITAEPEITTTQLKPGQPAFMILGSDGLWDTMGNEQAVNLVVRWLDWKTKGKPAAPASKASGNADWSGWKTPEEWFTVQDDNVAVHLTRNAFGGVNQDVVSGILSLKPPYSRHARDDMTVQVVFFNF
ncbi:phosphatase 2C-like domain-containing protein [Lasiosphaeria ovina]|uniref:Phosphatase 2C-like domain-containing protein n=1 Tax=Lasiosphaeria ovina TaxID=92902 RepID=A0AAE0KLL7_9PEZI|nr:phosphatase 2C-like domain-containing protein [Lasiosphaeria ovina]